MPRIHNTALVISVFTPILRPIRSVGLADALLRIDEHEAVTEAAMQKHGYGAERPVAVARGEIGRGRHFRHIEFVIAQKAPMARGGIHVGQDGEIDAVDLDLAV